MARRTALVAPDSFKGTFSATQVAAALARGLRAGGQEVVELPVADGGEGTMDALLTALGGERRAVMVADPLGRPVEAAYGFLPDGSAIVESAQASGLGRVPEAERDAWAASTFGTGELIAAAVRDGASPVFVAVGGTATTDGGEGAVAVLREAAVESELVALCDVRTPWEDAPRVFAPQKGADPMTVTRLERRLAELARRAPRNPSGIPMTGAGGGLAGGLWACCGAELVPGAPFVLDAVGFDEKLSRATLCITGEGSLDDQTAAGKVVAEITARCLAAGIPCHAVVGQNRLGAGALGLAQVIEAVTLDDLEQAGKAIAVSAAALALDEARNHTR
ncbi:MAG TPA: glycerate kinase [Gaiellaceae bacterium]|nr:glycerate kinase [Gaiellaceae bacterium]